MVRPDEDKEAYRSLATVVTGYAMNERGRNTIGFEFLIEWKEEE